MPTLHATSILLRISGKILTLTICYLLILTTTDASTQNYFPLSDKSKWEYVGRFSFTNGKQFKGRASMRVDGKVLINGKRYLKLVITGNFFGLPTAKNRIKDVRYYRIAEDGIYVRFDDNPNKPELIEIPLPIPIGVKWFSGTAEARVERAGTIKVNNHEYTDCLKITYNAADRTRSTEYYLAPGIGVVRAMYTDTTEPQSIMELTLQEYKQ